MDVTVNAQRCVGQGMCVLYAPQAFVLSDEDGRSEACFRKVPREQEDVVRRAAGACPEQAIVITE
jgi:ferredoxin